MSVSIAKTSQGFCAGACSLQIEPGEMFTTRNGVAVHVGCEGKARSTETAPTLFALTAAAPNPAKPERSQDEKSARFAAASVDQPSTRQRGSQRQRILELLSDGHLRTLGEIARATNCLPTSVSIRLREARANGRRIVMRRIEGTTTYEYGLQIYGESAHGPRAA